LWILHHPPEHINGVEEVIQFMAERNERETPAAMTANQASEAIQNSTPNESAAIEREQNQMFSAPGERAAEKPAE
jgi:hypothetical protein